MTPRLIVVGAGPAGVSAALWARTRFEVHVIERSREAGGQLRAIHFVPSELPGNDGMDGVALADACGRQLEQDGVQVHYAAAAAGLDLRTASRPAVRLEGGRRLAADAILIATGLRRRRLAVPGETEFEGRGISTSATRDRAVFAGRDVLVVGGGDAAFENALRLAEVGCQVTLAVRGGTRARRDFRMRVAAEARIELHKGTRVMAFLGDDRLRAVRLEGPDGIRERAFEGAVIKIGALPNTEWCARSLRTDSAGFVRADARGRTSRSRVWAAGDVVGPAVFAISVAAAGAAIAVHDAWRASAMPKRALVSARGPRSIRKRIRPGPKPRADREVRDSSAGTRTGGRVKRTTRRR